MLINEFKGRMAVLVKQAADLDQNDPVQRRAFGKVMDAASAVAKLKPSPVDQPELPLAADKAKGKGA